MTTLAICLVAAGATWLSSVQGLADSIWAAQKETPLLAIWFGADLLVALLLGLLSLPLGLGLAGLGLTIVATVNTVELAQQRVDIFAMIQYATAGGLMAVLVASLGDRHRRVLCRLVVALAVLEVPYAGFQLFQLDPLWFGWHREPLMLVIGSLRNPNYLANYLALAVPLTAGWVTPLLLFIGLYWTQSVLAVVAAAVGLVVSRGWRTRSWALPALGLAIALTASAHERSFGSWRDRLVAWDLAGHDFSHTWIWGRGLGSWAYRVPAAEYFFRGVKHGFHVQAHNEYWQWVYETGVPGAALLALLGWWVWRTKIWRAPLAGGAAVTAAILCLASFPLRIPGTAIQIVLIVGACLGWLGAVRAERRALEPPLRPAPFPFGARWHWGRAWEGP